MKHNGRLILGDCRRALSKLKEKTVHCVVTSPPYWNLRSYGIDQTKLGEVGREASLEKYIQSMVNAMREVKRVLRDDGTVFLNLGDLYIDSMLQGLPWKTALALASDGWLLRSDIIWVKHNSAPTNVNNRPRMVHEYIFLLSKQKKYFYDQYSILAPNGSFPRTLWVIPNTRDKAVKHFATWPIELPLRCIKAGTSEGGCCSKCGTPYQRQFKEIEKDREQVVKKFKRTLKRRKLKHDQGIGRGHSHLVSPTDTSCYVVRETIGFKKNCNCRSKNTVPCTVLDPFIGSGTSAVAAERLKRKWIGLDLYKRNLSITLARVNAALTDSKMISYDTKEGLKKIGLGLSRRT